MQNWVSAAYFAIVEIFFASFRSLFCAGVGVFKDTAFTWAADQELVRPFRDQGCGEAAL